MATARVSRTAPRPQQAQEPRALTLADVRLEAGEGEGLVVLSGAQLAVLIEAGRAVYGPELRGLTDPETVSVELGCLAANLERMIGGPGTIDCEALEPIEAKLRELGARCAALHSMTDRAYRVVIARSAEDVA